MADIGEKLRSAREAKGLSIADIEKATKIQGRYLTAIEQNDFDKLPGDFYTRAFIRQYAQVVGLDGKELLSEFHQDVPESKPDEYVENSIDNKSEEVKETTNNKKDLWKTYLPKIGIGLGVVVVILVVYFLYAKLSSGNQNSANTSNNVSVSSQSSSSVAPKVKKNSVKIKDLGNNQYQVTGLKSNRKLVVKAGDNATNVTISVNGNSQGQQSLQAGEKRSLSIPTDAQNVVVTFTNDTGTSIKIGGKKVPYTPTGAYRNITLLIGKRRSSNNNNNQNSNTTTTQGNTQRNSQREYRQPQSSTTQSSQTQTQSQTQSSQAQSSSTTTNTENTNRDNR